MQQKKRVWVVGLSDIGRSPRLQNHAVSFANQVGMSSDCFGLYFDSTASFGATSCAAFPQFILGPPSRQHCSPSGRLHSRGYWAKRKRASASSFGAQECPPPLHFHGVSCLFEVSCMQLVTRICRTGRARRNPDLLAESFSALQASLAAEASDMCWPAAQSGVASRSLALYAAIHYSQTSPHSPSGADDYLLTNNER